MKIKLSVIREQLQTQHTSDGRIPFHPILMMFAARQFGKSYAEFMNDYKVLVESNMKCLELFEHDAISVISDPFRETSAFGSTISFDGDNFPKAQKIVKSLEDAKQLRNPDVYKCRRTLDRINGIKYYRKLLGNNFPVIGWVEGPLAEAVDLSGMSEILTNMLIDPGFVKTLMEKCLKTAKDFALAQIEAGVNIIGVGDAVCSQVAPEMYEEFVLPLHKELFDFIHEKTGLVKLHICGDINHLLPYLSKLPIDILDIDWMVNMQQAHQVMGKDVVLCGNIDPVSVILNGSKVLIKEKYDDVKASIPVENWIMMGGCEIPVATPVENMLYLRKISK